MRFLDNNENETLRQGGLVDIGCEDGTLLIELLGETKRISSNGKPFFNGVFSQVTTARSALMCPFSLTRLGS